MVKEIIFAKNIIPMVNYFLMEYIRMEKEMEKEKNIMKMVTYYSMVNI